MREGLQVIGVRMHRTGSMSVKVALERLGFDKAHCLRVSNGTTNGSGVPCRLSGSSFIACRRVGSRCAGSSASTFQTNRSHA